LLTVKVAGLVARGLANGDDVADGGLIFALNKILHDLWDLLRWLGRFCLGRFIPSRLD
jgi:hypothetical protein